MKTTIYELLGMIKDDKFVKRILFRNQVYEYDEDGKDYYNEEYGWIFDEYDLISILNEPIEILETTITLNEERKIDKLYLNGNKLWLNAFDYQNVKNYDVLVINKINEIIEVLNERQD